MAKLPKAPYVYGGILFKTQKELTNHIQKAIDYYNRVPEREFFDPVLADVVQARHYIWRHTGVRPTKFKYTVNDADSGRPSEDSLSGYFGPDWGWHRFSYKKAVSNQDPDMRSEFTRLCRERWKLVWRNRLMTHLICEFPGCTTPAQDVDHVSMSHADITEAAWFLMTEGDKQTWWDHIVHKKVTEPYFQMPTEHVVTAEYDRLTLAGTYQCLCKSHHRGESRDRKLPGRSAVTEVFSDPNIDGLFD